MFLLVSSMQHIQVGLLWMMLLEFINLAQAVLCISLSAEKKRINWLEFLSFPAVSLTSV